MRSILALYTARMNRLSVVSAQQKRELFDALRRGEMPPFGEFDEGVWRDAKEKGEVQMGTTVFEPNQISYEFIYPGGEGALVLRVTVQPPERIVYMPIPRWVVDSIWQGEINGSPVFESEAREMVAEFVASLEPEANRPLFAPPRPTGKD